jgi:putative membrane protein
MPDKEKSVARSEEEIISQELKLADKLAIERTVLAADRTMLAGVRTSMSFIGFGFTIFNLLKYIQEHASTKIMRPHSPRNIGLFMLVAGTVPLLLMMIQYSWTLKRMGKKKSAFSNPNLQMASASAPLSTADSDCPLAHLPAKSATSRPISARSRAATPSQPPGPKP